MVAPFKPYSKYVNVLADGGGGSKYPVYTVSFTGSSQKKPFLNTAYSGVVNATIRGVVANNVSSGLTASLWEQVRVEATNLAYSRLVSGIGDTSQIGSTMTAERKATFGTLVSAVTTMLGAAKAVKQGKLISAARILGIAPPERIVLKRVRRKRGRKFTYKPTKVLSLPNGRQIADSISNRWLWWSYGVKPLVQDSYNALDVLQRPIPWKKIEGSAKAKVKYFDPRSFGGYTYTVECKIKSSMNIRVRNPNLFLANQLGLTNPLQWINEGIPFSFVADWFSNLSQVISSLTDFVGLEVTDPVTASKSTMNVVFFDKRPPSYSTEFEMRRFSRTLSTLAPPRLKFKYERFYWQRGANAVSLLVQLLPKK